MSDRKRVVVIGAGPGGYVAAVRAAQLGAEVTVIEKENLGGTCLNWGCIPSKIMKKTAEMLEGFRKASDFGIQVEGNIRPEMTALMQRKEKVLQAQRKGIGQLLSHNGISLINGDAKVSGPGTVTVSTGDGESTELNWDRLILAMGTRPMNIPVFPFDGKQIISSNDALCLEKVPGSVVIVGGGVIGCEFAFILSSLGTAVTVVEAMSRLLPIPSVDEDCSKILQREMKKRKIKFITGKTVASVEKSDDGITAKIGPSPFVEDTGKSTGPDEVSAEKMLVCIGRSPNSDNMGLDVAGVKMDDRGWIEVDDRMRTNIEGIYAIGDILGPSKVMLAHVASAEAMIAAENAMGDDRRMSYDVVPSAIFTMPEVANAGLTESQAKENGLDYRADTVLFRTLGKAQVLGEIAGQVKIVSDNETGRVLGVHMTGPHVTDLLSEGVLAIQKGCTVSDIAGTIHAHPTLAEIYPETALKAMDRSLHG